MYKYTSLTEERFWIVHERQFVSSDKTLERTALFQIYRAARPPREPESGDKPCYTFRAGVCPALPTYNFPNIRDVALQVGRLYAKRELDKPQNHRRIANLTSDQVLNLPSPGDQELLRKGQLETVREETPILRRRDDFLEFRILRILEEQRRNRDSSLICLSELAENVWAQQDDVGEAIKVLGERGCVRCVADNTGRPSWPQCPTITVQGQNRLEFLEQDKPWAASPRKGQLGFGPPA